MCAQANPTKSTLNAAEHEADLEAQRKKRTDANVIVKSTLHGGDVIPNTDLGYPMSEMEERKSKPKTGKSSPAPVLEGQA